LQGIKEDVGVSRNVFGGMIGHFLHNLDLLVDRRSLLDPDVVPMRSLAERLTRAR